MATHRTVWYIALGCALVAAVVLFVREAGEDAFDPRRPSNNAATLANNAMAALETDPYNMRPETETAVTAAAQQAIADNQNGKNVSAEAWYALGLYYINQKSPAPAEKALRNAIAAKPEWSRPYNALGILLANDLEKRAKEAEEAFRTSIRLEPEWSRPYNDLAILMRLTGRFDEAEAQALEALKRDPDSVATRNNYGNLLVVQGKLDLAEPEYRKAIELDPKHPKPYYNLACLYSLQGKREEALSLLTQALALSPRLREEAAKDRDLTPVRADPAFQKLLNSN